MARRCGVCGFESGEAVCPRCATILVFGEAVCPKCGKLFSGRVAVCDSCGTVVGLPHAAPEDEEAVHLLTALPGITEDRARALVARGFRDVADVVRLALPDRDVRRGLHHVIARRMLLSELAPEAAKAGAGDRCPVCAGRLGPGDDRCTTCGSPVAARDSWETLDRKLKQVTAELLTLAEDSDVREMPAEVRKDLLDAFGGMSQEGALRDGYRRQVDAWRNRGFDVTGLEELLDTDLDGFRERSVRLIRAQIRKKATATGFRCPLCEMHLPAEAERCNNCGAKFA